MPSDAVWTGVITGAVGVAGMAATGLTALRFDRRRLRAENERLRRQDDREQRKERGAAYYRTVILLNRLDRFAAGNQPDEDTLTTTIDEYNKSVSALHLIGVRPVLDVLRDLQRLTREVGDAMARRSPRGNSVVDAFVEAWNDLREAIMDAERRLVVAMRQDVGPHHAAPAGAGLTDRAPLASSALDCDGCGSAAAPACRGVIALITLVGIPLSKKSATERLDGVRRPSWPFGQAQLVAQATRLVLTERAVVREDAYLRSARITGHERAQQARSPRAQGADEPSA